jgi:hypothetical protein
MANTLGYHYVKSCYGLWLPGDDRGSWSEAWDEQIGFVEPHTLHAGDPVRHRMAEERMRYAVVRLSDMFDQSRWENAAQYIERHNVRHGRPARPYSFLM